MLGDAIRIRPVLAELVGIAERLGDPARMNRAVSYLGNYDWWTGRPDQGLPRYQVAYAAAVDESEKASLSFTLGEMYYSLGDYRHAIPFLRPAVAFFSGERIRERGGAAGFPAIFARTWLALTLAECGEMRAARTQADDAVQVAEEPRPPLEPRAGGD
jgi:tetratricopeptide (TPR) repeat protein